MNVPILGRTVDERFLVHRLRSTSLGGFAGILVAMGLFIYRCWHDRAWSWDLLAVGASMAVVKVASMLWYRFRD